MNCEYETLNQQVGYLGSKRDEKYRLWDQSYGPGNWHLIWKFGRCNLDFIQACQIYEDAYFIFLKNNRLILKDLVSSASDVYDDHPSNVHSGLDYTIQETVHTHLQDIAIRRSLFRLGTVFEGQELIQIRDSRGTHPLSLTLSPGRVPFHQPELIIQPELTGWWQLGSVESFYQSNRFLQVKSS